MRVLPAGLVGLTFATGMVDAISYLGLGRVFTANMTGNVVLLGFALARTPGFTVLGPVVALAAFLAGSAVGGALGPRFRVALALELALLAAAAGLSVVADRYVLIGVLGTAMGVRNAAVRRLAVPDLTTTVLTMTLTGLAADRSRRTAPRRIAAVAAMLAGAVVGAVLVRHDLTLTLVATAAVVATTLVAVVAARAA